MAVPETPQSLLQWLWQTSLIILGIIIALSVAINILACILPWLILTAVITGSGYLLIRLLRNRSDSQW